MQRRYLGLTAAAIATTMTVTLTGCGSGSGGDVTLQLVAADYGSGKSNGSRHYWDELARGFEKKHPGIKVDVHVYSWTDVDKKVADMVDSGHAPDLAQIGAYADYAAKGKLYSADQLLSIPTQANFTPPSRRPVNTSASSTACPSAPAPGGSSTTRSCSPRPASAARRRTGTTSPTTPSC